MKEELASARKHPAALASIVIASVAVTALAFVTIAYLLGWVPAHGTLPSGPGSMAVPGQQLAGTSQEGIDLFWKIRAWVDDPEVLGRPLYAGLRSQEVPDDPIVLAKRDAAVRWCTQASDHAATYAGKPWTYVLIPHDVIAENMTLQGLAAG